MGLCPKPLILRETKTRNQKGSSTVERITIKVKPDSRKMTPEELQGYLKAKAMGSGVTKNGKRYRRHEKHRRRL